MNREIFQEIEIPENVKAEISGNEVSISGDAGEIKKKFNLNKITLEKKGNKLIIGDKKATKSKKRMINTIAAHLRNMIKGANEKFQYKLKVCFSHFPMSVSIQGNQFIIKNFLGEKIERKMKITEGVEIKIDKDVITVISPNKELAGQVAAGLEAVTKIKNRDRRIFQDGIFITNKAGREI